MLVVCLQCRALQAAAGWEKRAEAVAELAAASEGLVAAYSEQNTAQSLYQAKMHLKGCCSKVAAAVDCAGCEGHLQLQALLQTVEQRIAEQKAAAKA